MKFRIGFIITFVIFALWSATAWCQQPITIRLGHVGFPGSLFADPTDHYLRVSLLSPTHRVKEAAGRMKAFMAKL